MAEKFRGLWWNNPFRWEALCTVQQSVLNFPPFFFIYQRGWGKYVYKCLSFKRMKTANQDYLFQRVGATYLVWVFKCYEM